MKGSVGCVLVLHVLDCGTAVVSLVGVGANLVPLSCVCNGTGLSLGGLGALEQLLTTGGLVHLEGPLVPTAVDVKALVSALGLKRGVRGHYSGLILRALNAHDVGLAGTPVTVPVGGGSQGTVDLAIGRSGDVHMTTLTRGLPHHRHVVSARGNQGEDLVTGLGRTSAGLQVQQPHPRARSLTLVQWSLGGLTQYQLTICALGYAKGGPQVGPLDQMFTPILWGGVSRDSVGPSSQRALRGPLERLRHRETLTGELWRQAPPCRRSFPLLSVRSWRWQRRSGWSFMLQHESPSRSSQLP